MKGAVLLPLLVFLSACAASPEARWAQQREAVTTTQDVIVSLHEAEVLDDDDVRKVGPWVVSARVEVNRAFAHLPDGGPEFDGLLDRARALIGRAKAVIREEQDDGTD